jgi:GT2 family glycosyltransferase
MRRTGLTFQPRPAPPVTEAASDGRGHVSQAAVVPEQHAVSLPLRLSHRWRELRLAASQQGAQRSGGPPAPPRRLPIVGNLDCPPPGAQVVAGKSIEFHGWAVARTGIQRLEAFLDGEPRGRCRCGISRPDVAVAYPDYSGAEESGFMGVVPADGLGPGQHTLTIQITGRDGQQDELHGVFSIQCASLAFGEAGELNLQYAEWLRRRSPTPEDLRQARARSRELLYRPRISLILTGRAGSVAMIESLGDQVYGNWEVCATDRQLLPSETRQSDGRETGGVLRFDGARADGPAAEWNLTMAEASGEFLIRCDEPGRLSPLALLEIASVLNQEPDLDLIYVDTDRVSASGVRWDPIFKPDWSPDLLLSMNYVAPFYACRRSLLMGLGGVRSGFDPAGESYDLVLRIAERTGRIHHIPAVLFSRLSATVPRGGERPETHLGAHEQRALGEAFVRRGVRARVFDQAGSGPRGARYEIDGQPGVTLVMPTGGRLEYLQPCLESVLGQSTYSNFRVLVVDNSEGGAVRPLCAAFQMRYGSVRYARFPLKPFDFSAICNHAARLVETPFLVLLNDDMKVVTPDWIEAMLEQAQRPEVGVVGAKLLYPNNTIQHAGVVLGPYENSAHAFKNLSAGDPGYFALPHRVRNCSAVTFACAMMRRSVFDEVNGLEPTLRVAYQDVDLCLKLREHGYWIVYTPHAVLYHYESVTKPIMAEAGEAEYMRARWGHIIERDPFYNPNLTRARHDYSLDMD